MFEGNASYLYIGNNASTAADAAAIDTIAVGSVAFCTEDNKVEKQAASTGVYRIANKLADGNMIFSPFFDMATRKNVVGSVYQAPVNQITYFGYNGSTGALDATAGEDYVMHFEWLNSQFLYNNSSIILSAAYHTSAASQYELAVGMLKSFNATMSRQPYTFIKAEAINNATVVAANGTKAGQEVTVVNGVNAVTFETDVTYTAGGAATLVVGDYLRIGTVGGGTALTSPVYKVTAIDTLTVTLDRPVTNASGTYDDIGGTSDVEVIPAASIGANWGFKFTGVDNSNFNVINDTYQVTRFKITSSGFVTAAVTHSTKAFGGVGVGNQIASLESYAQFLDKSSVIGAFPQIARRSEAVQATTYDICSFEIDAATFTSPTNGMTTRHTFRIQVATAVALNGDDIDTVLAVTV